MVADRLLAAQTLLRTRRLLPMWIAPGVVLCRRIGTDPILSLADHLIGELVGLVGDEAAMVLELAAHVGIPLPRLDGSYRVEDLFCGARLDGGSGAL
jgi:hypothetical protein